MTEGEIAMAIVTAVTGLASLYLTSRNRHRTQESRDRSAATAEWQALAERLKSEVEELRAELAVVRVAVQQLGREHEDCHRQLAALRLEMTGDMTLKEIKP